MSVKTTAVAYAQLLDNIRVFFKKRDVLEVQTQMLANYGSNDVYIDDIMVTINAALNKEQQCYLHTSAEIEMKRLLSNGSGDIYQICPVFRDNEYGHINRCEFTMLEWYRLGFDEKTLMEEVVDLLKTVITISDVCYLSYQSLFSQFVGVANIHDLDLKALQNLVKSHQLNSDNADIADLQTLLFVHLVEPELKKMAAVFVYDYPKEQAALAKIINGCAKRFELYLAGIELANGYQEITDVSIYQKRWLAQQKKRQQLAKKIAPMPTQFLTELNKKPLPDCAGVALGLSRLFMLQQGENRL